MAESQAIHSMDPTETTAVVVNAEGLTTEQTFIRIPLRDEFPVVEVE